MSEPIQVMAYSPPRGVMDFENRMKLAEMLVTTGFLPVSIKTPAQAVAIIQTGHELGIPPMQALRSIAVIQGKPTLSAELQLALFKMKGGKARWLESTNVKSVLELTHPNGDVHTETFTLEDAKQANLLGKDNWKNYPKLMLRARAISTGLRACAPDILMGIYNPDELGAEETPGGEIVVLPERLINAGKIEQVEYLDKLLAVPVFSQSDRDSYRVRAESGESMAVLINEVLTEGKKRGAEQVQKAQVEVSA